MSHTSSGSDTVRSLSAVSTRPKMATPTESSEGLDEKLARITKKGSGTGKCITHQCRPACLSKHCSNLDLQFDEKSLSISTRVAR